MRMKQRCSVRLETKEEDGLCLTQQLPQRGAVVSDLAWFDRNSCWPPRGALIPWALPTSNFAVVEYHKWSAPTSQQARPLDFVCACASVTETREAVLVTAYYFISISLNHGLNRFIIINTLTFDYSL